MIPELSEMEPLADWTFPEDEWAEYLGEFRAGRKRRLRRHLLILSAATVGFVLIFRILITPTLKDALLLGMIPALGFSLVLLILCLAEGWRFRKLNSTPSGRVLIYRWCAKTNEIRDVWKWDHSISLTSIALQEIPPRLIVRASRSAGKASGWLHFEIPVPLARLDEARELIPKIEEYCRPG